MKKLLFIAGIFFGALLAVAADDSRNITISSNHLVNITEVEKNSPTTVMIRSDGQLTQVEIKELPRQFLRVWNIPTMEAPSAERERPRGNHTAALPNGVALDLVWIPSGLFTMGSPDSEASRGGDEGPQTAVTISKGFWLGKTPVTEGQYQAVMGHNPSHREGFGPDVPVAKVSWEDAMEFCRKLTEQERAAGNLPEGYAYTLPTEAQWEYACRARTTEARYGDLDAIAWYSGNSGLYRNPVAQKQPNAWGLHDMLGNVWEWCSDWYGPYPGGNVTDPVGADSGTDRVVRGGSCSSNADTCRAALRCWHGPEFHTVYIGFRLALSSVPLHKAVTLAKAAVATPFAPRETGAPGKNLATILPNAVTLDLIWIAPGTFKMGSPDSETGRGRSGDEGPQTVVTISKGFWLGKTPVTQAQYRVVMGNNPSGFTDGGAEFINVGVEAPVETVTWEDAMAFCRKLTERERAGGRLPKGYAYTLPTEAQWEYACRAGTTGAGYGNLDDIAWYNRNSAGTTHPVAQKQPNAWGLYDMLGNVWEWCSDLYGAYPGGNVTDPVGADPGTTIYASASPVRVVRGGSYSSTADICRSACRSSDLAGESYGSFGFRVALGSFPSNKAVALANAATPADIAATVKELDRISKIPDTQPPWNNRAYDLGGEEYPKKPGDYIRIEEDRAPGFAQVAPIYSNVIVYASRGHCLRILQTYSSRDGQWFKVTSAYGRMSGIPNELAWIHESAGSVFAVKPLNYSKLKIGLVLVFIVAVLFRAAFWRAFFRR